MVLPRRICLGLAAARSLFISMMNPIWAAGNEKGGDQAAASGSGLPPQARMLAPGPEKGGLASLYPGDEGIERDPRVLFVEDFETGTVEEIGAR
jgi:hypothetical protein